MKKIILAILFVGSTALSLAQNNLAINNLSGNYQVVITDSGFPLVHSKSSGLWEIATDWNNGWPRNWISIQADSLETVNQFTILHGSAVLQGGTLKTRDAYQKEGNLIKCTRRWEWTGTDTLSKITLAINFESPGINKRVLIPGVIYYGNPAGKRSGCTPVLDGVPGEISVFEEHRLPMPFVSREWGEGNDSHAVAIHSLPSPVPFGNRIDQWWSMGIIHQQENSELCLMTGPCAFNGKKGVIKAFQGKDMMESYDEVWMSLPPNTVIEKTFYIQGEAKTEQGHGFQQPVETSMDLFQPWELNTLPNYDEILTAKIRFALSRYQEGSDFAGFKKYPDRDYFVLGWCGQSMAPGYAFQVLKKEFPLADQTLMVQHSLDFLSSSKFYESGFYTWYNIQKAEWFMNYTPEWLSQGQAMLNIANAIRVVEKEEFDTGKWIDFLAEAANFHSARIMNEDWNPESTNEGFFIAPLVLASKILSNSAYLEAARKAASYYADLYLTMDQVYWGGTLDASCEDKEGAFAALQGFIELYELTKEEKYLMWAKHAGDVCLTYTVVWDIPMPPGRLTDHSFKSRGWTAVSVQNMHIDVYGVLIAPYIYRLGKALEKESYLKTAELMFRTCGQLIDPYGSQGEQPYHTNYIQNSWRNKPMYERRGNYHETWTVFWITAHFLNAGAMMMELGVF